MQLELITLQKEVGITFIYVTHDQQEALALAQRIAVMNHGQIEQLDEPSRIYGFPKNRFVADFIGTCNLLEASVKHVEGDQATLDITGLGQVHQWQVDKALMGTKGVLAVRPEKISIGHSLAGDAQRNKFRGKVFDFLYFGDVTIYVVEMDNGKRIEAMLPDSASGRAKFFEAGDVVEVSWLPDAGTFLTD